VADEMKGKKTAEAEQPTTMATTDYGMLLAAHPRRKDKVE
jgi:hypothetical protein